MGPWLPTAWFPGALGDPDPLLCPCPVTTDTLHHQWGLVPGGRRVRVGDTHSPPSQSQRVPRPLVGDGLYSQRHLCHPHPPSEEVPSLNSKWKTPWQVETEIMEERTKFSSCLFFFFFKSLLDLLQHCFWF